MRSHEQELISALVEGRLEDEAEALALIASSPALRSEYEAQKLAYDALSGIPRAQLTDHERAALRRDVWTELQAQPTSLAVRTPWYFRWSTAAAGLFIVVGFVTIMNLGGIGSQDTAAEAFPDTSITALTANRAVEEDADDGTAVPSAGAATAEDQAVIPDPTLQAFNLLSEELRFNDPRDSEAPSSNFQTFAAEHESCLTEAALEGYEVVSEFFHTTVDEYGTLETAYLAAVPVDQPTGPGTPIAYVVLATCTLIYIDE